MKKYLILLCLCLVFAKHDVMPTTLKLRYEITGDYQTGTIHYTDIQKQSILYELVSAIDFNQTIPWTREIKIGDHLGSKVSLMFRPENVRRSKINGRQLYNRKPTSLKIYINNIPVAESRNLDYIEETQEYVFYCSIVLNPGHYYIGHKEKNK
jgi:hypothetical protein